MQSNHSFNFENVKNVSFSRNKYGPELLIDVAWISNMPSFEKSPIPYRIDFYDITLIISGNGSFWLDNQEYIVEPGTVLFTSPGQVRRWFVEGLDGICLFFPAEFILEHFNDTLFLHRLRYFHSNQAAFSLSLNAEQRSRLRERMKTMLDEIKQLSGDSNHLLRAIAYEILVNLNRWYAQRYGHNLDGVSESTVSKFREVLERKYRETHQVSDFAKILGLTPGHLNHLCKKHLGQTASKLIESRVMSEACRLLVHTDRDLGALAMHLGFADPSYFSRAFRRFTKVSPRDYRIKGKQRLHQI
ncbi:AraC family transcriptional regulator [Aliiglaciecola sp. M165]|uniref:AraC family transcriptional regulator n=1 Tax=Aliiglaciecola sp. M165 TaxID=2593649 RepID=UPI00117DB8A9|nr:AraC family transcriptional regulator [Aliiglaciecola sp. M165]TRY30718.1 helix-turn-helix domain-containing protein [Aliiglaciecola sp. M165]